MLFDKNVDSRSFVMRPEHLPVGLFELLTSCLIVMLFKDSGVYCFQAMDWFNVRPYFH